MDWLKKNIPLLLIIVIALIYTGIILFWHLYNPKINITIQNPGADNRPEGKTRKADEVIIGEFFLRYSESSSSLTGKWACFRGNGYQNIVHTDENINFSSEFSLVWKTETGEGHAAPVIYNGLVYF
ncbi:MAG: hypothetical protein FWH59_02985, partial [Lentimicrobiaceae bacterium]|nr:hypothetical protein [Lentimicrobiaceae bacterium]